MTNKNKEAIKHLEGIALILKSRHMCKSMDAACSHDEIVEYREQFESIKIAIEALEAQDHKCENCKHRSNRDEEMYWCNERWMCVDDDMHCSDWSEEE